MDLDTQHMCHPNKIDRDILLFRIPRRSLGCIRHSYMLLHQEQRHQLELFRLACNRLMLDSHKKKCNQLVDQLVDPLVDSLVDSLVV
jgi:hypothetical protein